MKKIESGTMHLQNIIFALIVFLSLLGCKEPNAPVSINAEFPGGNIKIDSIVENTVFLKPDQKGTDTTKGNWFYWYFEVNGCEGRNLKFVFNQQHSITRKGPAYSKDKGKTWQFLYPDTLADQDYFTFSFDDDDHSVRFCLTIPYTNKDLNTFEKNFQRDYETLYQKNVLTKTSGGRQANYLVIKNPDEENIQTTFFITARHHACETTANFVWEGMVEIFAEKIKQNHPEVKGTQMIAVPFVDFDGVQLGEQGKNRFPHDHNRDYIQFRYPETEALAEVFKNQSAQSKIIAIDLHSPWIKYQQNEWLFFIGQEKEAFNQKITALSNTIASLHNGELPFDEDKGIFPFARDWNNRTLEQSYLIEQMSFAQWCSLQPNVVMATTLEIPYSHVMGTTISKENLRQFGRSVMNSLIQSRQ
ncbi:MAG: M14 family zinc carboxypeptidase [Bacteroidota bacterium]